MGMSMGMSVAMTMRMILVCATCHGDRNRDDPDAFEAGLVGAVPYKICPNCNKTVDDKTMKDPNYRRRVRRLLARRLKRKAR